MGKTKSQKINSAKEKTKDVQDIVIDLNNNIFDYKNNKFSFICVGKGVYLRGKDVAKFLEYTNPQKAIRDHVREKYKSTLAEVINSKEDDLSNLARNQKNTIYLSVLGVSSLLSKKNTSDAEEFQDFLNDDIIPILQDIFSYSLFKKVIFDTSFIKSFYSDNKITDFFNRNVVYLGVIGILDDEFLIKFGKSGRIFDREILEHRKTFGDQFKIICIIQTDNNKEVEDRFKQAIKVKGLDRKIFFNRKNRTELFVTTENFTINNAMDLMKMIAEENQLPIIKEKDNKIKELENKLDLKKEI
jgi:hypothetical protein